MLQFNSRENIMYKDYDLGVVIPVRLGSSRVSQKALLPVGPDNIPLLAWKICQLKKVIPSDNIYISTEADELKEIALSEGVKIHHRDYYLADGHKASFSEVIVGVVKDIPHEHIAWVTCVVPLMSPQEYLQGFREYKQHVLPESTEFDSLVSVNLLKEYFWDDSGTLNYKATKEHTISQDLPNMYRVTNGLYMSSKESMLKNEYILGEKPYKSCVSKIAGIDIDEYEDYEMARDLIGIYKSNESKVLADKMVFLDFDGVIFDSAIEAYAVAMITSGKAASLQDVDINSYHAKAFLSQRYQIGPAWNYYYLLNAIDQGLTEQFSDFLPDQPGNEAKEFMASFFATRKNLRKYNWDNWLALNKLYDGSKGFLELLENYENSCIVTTKDKETVQALLKTNGVSREVNIFDASDYEKHGCKSRLMDGLIKGNSVNKAIFVDDSHKHLNKCNWVNNLEVVHARWGYVAPDVYQDNKAEVLNQITAMLQG